MLLLRLRCNEPTQRTRLMFMHLSPFLLVSCPVGKSLISSPSVVFFFFFLDFE